MKACPDKHFTLALRDDKFCTDCGKALIELPVIKCACGNILGPRNKFCSRCGQETRLAA